ncbi:MAG: hypothetical protein IT267_02410 [Saprospiraceae bacterium]|nr:hypothetical protein [Saprospiraceae bacterium]
MPKILAIECTTFNYSLAYGDDYACVLNKCFQGNPVTHLTKNLKDFLDEAGIHLNDLDCFGLDLGPGSYSALRGGISILKGLVSVCQKPIVGLEKDQILRSTLKYSEDWILTSIISLKNKHMFSLYKDGHCYLKDLVAQPYDLNLEINFELPELIHVVGENVELVKLNVPIKIKRTEVLLEAKELLPLVYEQFSKGNFVTPMMLLPKYYFEPNTTLAKKIF